jgi:signal transduction histidine kinase
MGWFAFGLVLGGLGGLLLTAFVALVAHRRYERLQRRARHVERLAELGTLTGGLAHEIKNPLSTVQLNLQLLREDLLPDNPAYSRLVSRLETVQKETARLRDILDDFLRYAGKIELDRKPIDLNRLLEELVDFFTPQAQHQRVQLRVKPSDAPVEARVDERMIKQAVLNLMINALQAMPEQGGEIMLAARREPDGVRLDVMDTGRGISPEALGKIFDAYYSTKRGGTGLGLAIARRIAEEHGGRISAVSEVGKGSVFTIELPVD